MGTVARQRAEAPARSHALFQLVLVLGLLRRSHDRPGRACHGRHPLVHEVAGSTRGDLHRRKAQHRGCRNPGEHIDGRPVPRELSGRLHARLPGHAVPLLQRPDEAVPRQQGPLRRRPRILRALSPSTDLDPKPSVERRSPGTFEPATRAHIRNFLECIRSRKDPNATVEMAQTTVIVLCMAMDSMRKGRRLRWDAGQRKVV